MVELSGRRMLRYKVPVDGAWHTLELRGPIRHVASRDHRAVELWAQYDAGLAPPERHALIVVGTGQEWPEPDDGGHLEWVGTALAPAGLVWHLLRLREPS